MSIGENKEMENGSPSPKPIFYTFYIVFTVASYYRVLSTQHTTYKLLATVIANHMYVLIGIATIISSNTYIFYAANAILPIYIHILIYYNIAYCMYTYCITSTSTN